MCLQCAWDWLRLARSLLLSFMLLSVLAHSLSPIGRFKDLLLHIVLKIFIYFITLLLPLNEFRVSLRFMASHVWRRDGTRAFLWQKLAGRCFTPENWSTESQTNNSQAILSDLFLYFKVFLIIILHFSSLSLELSRGGRVSSILLN